MKKPFWYWLFAMMLSIAFVPASAQESAGDCSRFELNPDNAWNSFKSDLEEGGIPLELWGEFVGGEGVQLEDYGITPQEMVAFFQANRDSLSNLLDNNPLRPYIERALVIMSRYGLGQGDMSPLLAVQSNLRALFEALGARGLSTDRADAFLTEIAPLVREASDKGLLEYGVIGELDVELKKVSGTLTPEFLREFWDDFDALEQLLLADGEDPEAVAALMASLNSYKETNRVTDDLLRNFEIESEKSQLEKYGVPPTAIRELVGEDKTTDDVANCLNQIGLSDAELLRGRLGDLGGLTLDDLNAFYADEMVKFLALSGLDPEALRLLYGMSEEQQWAFFAQNFDAAYADLLVNRLKNAYFFAAGKLGELDDTVNDLARTALENLDDGQRQAILDELTAIQALSQLTELDEETFAALFNDPAALEEWIRQLLSGVTDSADSGDDSADSGDDSADSGDDSADSGDDSNGVINNWCDVGGKWEGKCDDPDPTLRDWLYNAGWYYAQVDKGVLRLEQIPSEYYTPPPANTETAETVATEAPPPAPFTITFACSSGGIGIIWSGLPAGATLSVTDWYVNISTSIAPTVSLSPSASSPSGGSTDTSCEIGNHTANYSVMGSMTTSGTISLACSPMC